MIATGGRTDVIVQWFSSKYVHGHPKIFDKMLAGPGEAIILLKDGKVEEVATESKFSADVGFLSRLLDKIRGTDRQLLMVDLTPKSISIPFSGYSKDRTKIGGVANLTVRVDLSNVLRLMNLVRRETVSDAKWASTDFAKDIKEVTLEDIAGYMAYDTSLVIDSSLLSQTLSSEIRDNQDSFDSKMRNTIMGMCTTWVNNGLAIDFAKAEIGENAYEDAMKYADELAKLQLKQDADFADKNHNLDLEADLNVAIVRNAAKVEMASVVAEYEKTGYIVSMENKAQLEQLDHEQMVAAKEMRNQLEIAKSQLEIDRINGISIEESARRQTDLEEYDAMSKVKVQEYVKDQDQRRTLEIMAAQRQQEIDKAFSDGYDQGKEQAAKDAYDRGHNEGFNEGLKEGMDRASSFGKDIFSTAASGFSGRPMNTAPVQQEAPAPKGKFCPWCGTSNPPQYKFCCNCGKSPNEE